MRNKRSLFLVLAVVFLTGCVGPGAEPAAPAETPVGPVEASPTPDLSQPVSSDDPTPTGEAPRSPLDPIPGEENMDRGQVFIDSSELLILESYPVQVNLRLEGALPTPCHQLRAEVGQPDEQNRIEVEVYSLVDPETICIQVLEPFQTNIPLGSYPSGRYTVWVNGEQVGEFSA